LLLPTATYRASDFVAAAAGLGVDVVVGSEHRQALSGSMGDRAVVLPLADVGAAVGAIVALHRRSPLDAVLAVDDQGVVSLDEVFFALTGHTSEASVPETEASES